MDRAKGLPQNPRDWPLVSVVIGCRNEEGFIRECLDSIRDNGYPADRLDVLVMEGNSTDRSPSILKEYSERHPFVRVIPNPARITPVAFNIGVRESRGDYIMLMSAHATYEKGAIQRCVDLALSTGAENVGGVWKIHTRRDGVVAQAIACVLSHPFGVGGASYRTETGGRPRWADTAAYGCYRKDVFRRIGLFNEKLVHSQDMEFNLRLKKAGGRTLLVPDVVIHYSTRSDFRSFMKHNFRNGVWVILPFALSPIVPVSFRHLVPLGFVAGVCFLGAASFFSVSARGLLAGIGVLYAVTDFAAAAALSWREKKTLLFPILVCLFPSLHVTYGVGSVVGIFRLAFQPLAWRRLFAVWGDGVKRGLDVVLSFAALIVLSPVMLVSAGLVRWTSKGPALYRGVRVGRYGKLFKMLKFRTMVVDAEARGGPSTAADDPRIVPLGAFLRRWKLDELPQLLNVLGGQMSIVGPRPQVVDDVERYSNEERALLEVRPGLTDLASIRFHNEGEILKGHPDPDKAYDTLIRDEKIKLGLRYVRERSLWLDVKIILLTLRPLLGLSARIP
ncbi:MAG: sugar transferase [Elusimicrobia bacterium]|nr:sugar transferase [Elusimicrobiota bacterium]